MKRVILSLGALVVVGLLAGQAWSATAPAKKDSKEKDPATLAAEAFEVKAKLRSDQQQKLAHVKQQYEHRYRTALEKVQAAKNDTEKTTTGREAAKIRMEINKEIKVILASPDPEMVRRMQEAAKRAQQQKKNQPKPKKRR